MINQFFNEDAEFLINLCEERFDCDLKEKNRVRNNVNARVAYGVLMRERGYTYAKIGELIDRDHATIVHYSRQADMYLKTDEDFKNKFDLVKKEFDEKRIDNKMKKIANFVENKDKENYQIALPHYNEELIKHINLLNKEKKDLYLEIEILKLSKGTANASTDRVKKLIDIVIQRTRKGKEEEIETKLNRFYNTMEY